MGTAHFVASDDVLTCKPSIRVVRGVNQAACLTYLHRGGNRRKSAEREDQSRRMGESTTGNDGEHAGSVNRDKNDPVVKISVRRKSTKMRKSFRSS